MSRNHCVNPEHLKYHSGLRGIQDIECEGMDYGMHEIIINNNNWQPYIDKLNLRFGLVNHRLKVSVVSFSEFTGHERLLDAWGCYRAKWQDYRGEYDQIELNFMTRGNNLLVMLHEYAHHLHHRMGGSCDEPHVWHRAEFKKYFSEIMDFATEMFHV